MSLEAALEANTAALTRVADLLEISNSDRAKLLASASGVTPSPAPAPSADEGMSVADIKEAAKSADAETLGKMLAAEKAGKNRATALKAIEDAMSAANAKEGYQLDQVGESSSDVGSAASNSQQPTEPSPSTTASAAPASDKNAQPVPAEIAVEAATGAFGAWFGETDDEGERAKRREFVQQIVATLGSRIGELDNTGRRKAIFFLRRQRAGLPIDFGAAYDFDGSPTQDAPGAAAPSASATDDLL